MFQMKYIILQTLTTSVYCSQKDILGSYRSHCLGIAYSRKFNVLCIKSKISRPAQLLYFKLSPSAHTHTDCIEISYFYGQLIFMCEIVRGVNDSARAGFVPNWQLNLRFFVFLEHRREIVERS